MDQTRLEEKLAELPLYTYFFIDPRELTFSARVRTVCQQTKALDFLLENTIVEEVRETEMMSEEAAEAESGEAAETESGETESEEAAEMESGETAETESGETAEAESGETADTEA